MTGVVAAVSSAAVSSAAVRVCPAAVPVFPAAADVVAEEPVGWPADVPDVSSVGPDQPGRFVRD